MKKLLLSFLLIVSFIANGQMKVPVGFRKYQADMTEVTYKNETDVMFTFRAMGQEVEDGLDSFETQRLMLDNIYGAIPYFHHGYMNYERVPMYNRNIDRYIYHIYKDYVPYVIVISSPRNDKEFTKLFQTMVIALENTKEYFFK